MSVTRREFLVIVPAVVLAPAPVPVLADPGSPQSPGGWEAASAAVAGAPVVSFHLDQPYLDLTGTQEPFVPPVGMRSGASLAALSEEEILSRFYGFI